MLRIVFLLSLLVGALFTAAGYMPADRTSELESTLIAPCCWSETIAAHRSPVALEMRREVARFVAAGKSDREILDYYKAKYGPRILVEPEGAAAVIANVMPWIATALGALALAAAVRRMARRRVAEPQTASIAPELPDDTW